MTSSAVGQAIALLRGRLSEALTEVTRLQGEASQIRDALMKLGEPDPALPTGHQHAPAVQAAQDTTAAGSVTSAVHSLMDTERGPWTPSALRQTLADAGMQGGRTDKQFGDTIRTALYTLRKRGLIETGSDHSSVATKWCTYAEAPAETGASETEEPMGGSSRQEGESRERAAILPRGGDHDPDYSGRGLHHG